MKYLDALIELQKNCIERGIGRNPRLYKFRNGVYSDESGKYLNDLIIEVKRFPRLSNNADNCRVTGTKLVVLQEPLSFLDEITLNVDKENMSPRWHLKRLHYLFRQYWNLDSGVEDYKCRRQILINLGFENRLPDWAAIHPEMVNTKRVLEVTDENFTVKFK